MLRAAAFIGILATCAVWASPTLAANPANPANPDPVQKARKVLIITGDDYPGHRWKLTAPILAAGLGRDVRLTIRVVEDPNVLASDALNDHNVVVLHWMNWQKPDPGEKARDNLRRFVEGGKGLVLVHFACGAFQDWPEFRNLAGRSYDPKLRGHDPHGPFRVEIADAGHPITRGLAAFEMVDELYTCLAGDEPVRILATARSKVDGKDYPIAFVLNYGKGRVFHCPLGHDVKALENAGAAELLRRGVAWAAGLPPAGGQAASPPAATAGSAAGPAAAGAVTRPATSAPSAASAKRKIIFIPGPPSHGYGQHAHPGACVLLARILNENMPGTEAIVCKAGWPKDPAVLDAAKAIVVSCDGGSLIQSHLAELDVLMGKGVGLVCLHYTVDVPKGRVGQKMLDWIGGYYEQHWSVNPTWDADFKTLPDHPIARGVKPFHISDEWYYHMRFQPEMKGITPILTAVPPDGTRKGPDGAHSGNPTVRSRVGMPEHVAWAYQRPDGGRGFGFTGVHTHWNWAHDGFRTIVLNAVVWAAGGDVPQGGVHSKTPTLEELEECLGVPRPAGFKPDAIRKMIERFRSSP